MKTIIQVSKNTAKMLKDLRLTERESYDEILQRLIKIHKEKKGE